MEEKQGDQKDKPVPVSVKMDGYDFFCVEPITNCPHVTETVTNSLRQYLDHIYHEYYEKSKMGDIFSTLPCASCGSTAENWVCLTTLKVLCSRYQQSHMVKHYEIEGHPTCLSFSDGSFNCYECDNYITSKELDKIRLLFGYIKHRMIPKGMQIGWDTHLDEQIKEFKENKIKAAE